MLSFFRKNKSTSTLSDKELIDQYQKTEDVNFITSLLERYSSLIYGICLKYLKDEVKSEDAFMQIFEKLIKKLKDQEISNFKSWLGVVTKNHCLETLRQQKKHLTVSLDQGLMQNEPFLHPFEEDDQEIEFTQLEQCLEQLTGIQKECVQLFYYQNKSYKDISELKSLSLGKIRSSIQNGRRNLKICMEEFLSVE